MGEHNRVLSNWQNELYSCRRCGSQFLRGRSKYTPKDSIKEVLTQL
jgi:hypothetical protein